MVRGGGPRSDFDPTRRVLYTTTLDAGQQSGSSRAHRSAQGFLSWGSEADFVADLAGLADAYGWETRREFGDKSHRIDLLCRRDDKVLVVEAKLWVTGSRALAPAYDQLARYLASWPEPAVGLVVVGSLVRRARPRSVRHDGRSLRCVPAGDFVKWLRPMPAESRG